MLTTFCSVMIFVLSRAELVVKRKNEGLTAVPRDINDKVTRLDLFGNKITRLENDSFDYLLLLEELHMSRNGVTFFERHAFEKNTNMYLFKMYGHELSIFPAHFGGALHRIVSVNIRVDKHEMESMQILNFIRLNILDIGRNKIQTGNLVMQSLPALEELYAPDCNLTVFPNISAVPSLKSVQLHFNYFREIPAFAVRNLSRLQTFAFAGCHVTHLPDLSHLVSLKKLVINDNELVAIPDIYHLPLKWIEWAENPMDCSTSLCWVRMWYDVKPKALKMDVSSGSQLTCASPPEMAGLHLAEIHPVAMKCYAGDSNVDLWQS